MTTLSSVFVRVVSNKWYRILRYSFPPLTPLSTQLRSPWLEFLLPSVECQPFTIYILIPPDWLAEWLKWKAAAAAATTTAMTTRQGLDNGWLDCRSSNGRAGRWMRMWNSTPMVPLFATSAVEQDPTSSLPNTTSRITKLGIYSFFNLQIPPSLVHFSCPPPV